MAIFNEEKLGEEIITQWGEFGAHYEVYRNLIKERDELKQMIIKE